MSSKDKIQAIMNHFNMSGAEFASSLGYQSAGKIYDVLREKTKGISQDIANRILSTFPEIRKAWLLADDGQMLVNGTPTGFIPLLNIDSVGGMMHTNSITDSENNIVKYVYCENSQTDDIAIYQTGDSMEPIIPAWSILHLRQVKDWQDYLNYGAVYVLELKDGRRITKQIQRCKEEPHAKVLCVSYNEKYPPYELSRGDISTVWKLLNYIVECGQ